MGRDYEGRLRPMSVVFPGLACSRARKELALRSAPELSPKARLLLWNAAVDLLAQNSSLGALEPDDVLPRASTTTVISEASPASERVA